MPQISLTWADVVITLLIGFAGSLLAAYVYVRLPRWRSLAATWLAERSRRAAHARIAELTKEVDHVDRLRSDPSQLNAWMISTLGSLVMYVALGLFSAIVAGSISILIDVSEWF